MTDHTAELKEAVDRLDRYIRGDKICRELYHDGDRFEDGTYELMCPLAALAPCVIDEYGEDCDTNDCPTWLMPAWMAHATTWFNDYTSERGWRKFLASYAETARCFLDLNGAAWLVAKHRFSHHMVKLLFDATFESIPDLDTMAMECRAEAWILALRGPSKESALQHASRLISALESAANLADQRFGKAFKSECPTVEAMSRELRNQEAVAMRGFSRYVSRYMAERDDAIIGALFNLCNIWAHRTVLTITRKAIGPAGETLINAEQVDILRASKIEELADTLGDELLSIIADQAQMRSP